MQQRSMIERIEILEDLVAHISLLQEGRSRPRKKLDPER